MLKKTRNKIIILFSSALILVFTLALSMEQKQGTKVTILDRDFPQFVAEDLLNEDQPIQLSDINQGHYQLVNVWASWCGVCQIEHEYLNELKNKGIPIVGINYRDNKSEAIKLIKNTGNPFNRIIFDHLGDLSLDLGVIGTPETYLLDPKGRIIMKISGVLDPSIWNEYIKSYFQDNKK